MYMDCGSLVEACEVFDGLPARDVISWTALITGHVEHGLSEEALLCLEQMKLDGISPNAVTYVCCLRACGGLGAKDTGLEIHTKIVSVGLERDPCIANSLVDMYVRCCLFMEAQEVFDKLQVQDVVSWNALIAGYAEQGLVEEVIKYSEQMQLKGVPPDGATFVCILKCCGDEQLDRGREIHANIVKDGFERDSWAANTLVSMYAKCGLLAEAWEVFNELPDGGDVVSWTALISGYAEYGLSEGALNCLEQMQSEGVAPNAVTFVCSLKACCSIGAIESGQETHLEIVKKGFDREPAVGSSLVDTYAKCRLFAESEDILSKLPIQDVVSWSSLVAGYAENGLGEEALYRLEQMRLAGVLLSDVTYLCSLKACGSIGAIGRGRELHSEIVKVGLESDTFVGTTLVDMYLKCGSITEAQQLFDVLPVQNEVSWNALIAGYADHGLGDKALTCFKQMQSGGSVLSDAATFVCTLKGIGSICALEQGEWLHDEIAKEGFETDLCVGSALVDMYVKCDSFAEARGVFDELLIRDEVLWTTLIAGYVEHGLGIAALSCLEEMQMEGMPLNSVTYVCCLKACGNMYVKCSSLIESQMVFNMLPVRDVVSWTALMTGYVELGVGGEALDCSEQMQSECISPNDVTFICILKACDSTGAIGRGQETHSEIVKKGFENDGVVGNTLIDMYAKCGLLAEAWAVFDKLLVRDVASWNALIAGYAEHERGEEALNCLDRMQLEGLSLDAFTLIGSLRACASIQELEKGQGVHMEVVKKGCEREPFVGNTIVNMYAKCGSLADSCAVFDRLPVRDVVSWNALITGYAEHGYDEEAFKSLEQMQLEGVLPDAISWNVVIFSSAEQGESEKAIQLYAHMQEQGLLPEGAVSLSLLKACGNIAALEMGQKIHTQMYRVGGFKATEVYLANGFIDMYSKCGSVDSAQQVFDAMPTRDIVTWNALIGGYSRQGESKLVLSLLRRMIKEGVQPDEVTFLSILAVYNHAGLLHQGHKVFEAMREEFGISPTIKHYSSMVDLLGRAGRLDEAALLLEEMPFEPNLTVCHSVLCACQRWGNVEIALQVFECAVRLDPKHPAAYILMSSIYSDANMLEDAKKIDARRVDIEEKELS